VEYGTFNTVTSGSTAISRFETTVPDGLLHETVCHLVRTRVRWRNLAHAQTKTTVKAEVSDCVQHTYLS
jgi:hypothetical protein